MKSNLEALARVQSLLPGFPLPVSMCKQPCSRFIFRCNTKLYSKYLFGESIVTAHESGHNNAGVDFEASGLSGGRE